MKFLKENIKENGTGDAIITDINGRVFYFDTSLEEERIDWLCNPQKTIFPVETSLRRLITGDYFNFWVKEVKKDIKKTSNFNHNKK